MLTSYSPSHVMAFKVKTIDLVLVLYFELNFMIYIHRQGDINRDPKNNIKYLQCKFLVFTCHNCRYQAIPRSWEVH